MPGPFKAWAGAGDAYLVELGAGLVYLGSILVPSWFPVVTFVTFVQTWGRECCVSLLVLIN